MSKHTDYELHIELSNTKENRLSHQLDNCFRDGGIVNIGVSRYKMEQEIKAQNPQATETDMCRQVGITGYSSLHNTQSKTHIFGAYAFKELGVKNLFDIKAGDVKTFLNELCEREYSIKTVQGYISAIEKLDVALSNVYPSHNRGDWVAACQEMRAFAKEVCPKTSEESRAFVKPEAVIGAIADEKAQFGASLALDYGLRQNEVCHNHKINETTIAFRGKGGMMIQKELTPSQMAQYNKLFPEGSMNMKVDGYAYQIKCACSKVGENYTGTHSFRHNFAQNDMVKYTNEGYSRSEALHLTSVDMGHSREAITEIYLR